MTLFPQMCSTVISESITGRAAASGILDMNFIDIRDYSLDKHRRVDDYPYGGGCGMVMQVEPIIRAWRDITKDLDYKPLCIYMSPQGRIFNQETAKRLASDFEHIVFLCGHYEGVDERVIEEIVDMELSIGDYVLTGGEIPAMAVIDAVSRMVPGVLSGEASYSDESIYNGLLEYPQYTKPVDWRGEKVPAVLLSGNHGEVEKWRRREALLDTKRLRPDLFEKYELKEEEKRWLEESSSD